MIDTIDEAGFAAALRLLAVRDSALASVLREHGTPEFWHRPPGFATLVLFIVEQQVSLASARAVFERIVTATGGVTPSRLLAAGGTTLGSCGLTRQKLGYVLALAESIQSGAFDLTALGALDDTEARARLLTLSGIGPWTADVYLLSALRRPDVWPSGDRALQLGTAEVLEMEEVPGPVELETIAVRWQPWRAVAARILWHAYLSRRGREETTVGGLDGSSLPV